MTTQGDMFCSEKAYYDKKRENQKKGIFQQKKEENRKRGLSGVSKLRDILNQHG